MIAIPITLSDRQRTYEIAAVVVTGVGKIVFMDLLHWRLIYIVLSITGWAGYCIYQNKKTPQILRYWGFRTDNFREVAIRILPFGIISVITFFLIGYQRETINLSWHIIPILFLYPIWGTVQQFLVIGLVAGNLQDLKEKKPPQFVIITATAVLFGLVHYPNYWLMAGTFVLALLYGYTFLRGRNVYVLGLFHGWLGALFYYTVVGRDPFTEVFGKLFH